VMLFHAHISTLPMGRGYLAVDFFFLLSGIVISRRYEPELAAPEPGKRTGFARYMGMRLARLYPMLLLGGLIGVGTYWLGLSDFLPSSSTELNRALVSQFSLVPLVLSLPFFAFNRVQWSIVLELAVNALHAALARWLTVRRLCALVIASGTGLAVLGLRRGSLDLSGAADVSLLLLCIFRASFGFFAGVLIQRSETVWANRIPRLSFALSAAILLFVLGGNRIGLADWLYDVTCALIAFPLLAMAVYHAEASSLSRQLGVLSYPLYAIHLPLLDALRNGDASEAQAIAALPVLLGLAWAIGRWIDEPLCAWRRRRSRSLAAANGRQKVGDTAPFLA